MPEIPPVPPLFLARMKQMLGEEYRAFVRTLSEAPVSGLRVNTLKLPAAEFSKISPFPLGEKVGWCEEAFALTPTLTPSPSPDGRGEAPPPLGEGLGVREHGKHPYHLAGLYYLQDPSAMSAAALLQPQPGERILDLAAAPGGKATHLATRMQGQGLLVANEIKEKRLGHLAFNMERWGAGNVVITNETPERLGNHFGAFFDRVLVDAPCSGEGMFRKDMGARGDWSLEMVAGCAVRQKAILRVAARLVRPGGWLMYSTCTFAPEEDEQVIATLLDEFSEYEVSPLPEYPGFLRGNPKWGGKNTKQETKEELSEAVRLYPHRIEGEGHFICLLKRGAEGPQAVNWIPERMPKPNRREGQLWRAFAGEALQVDLPGERLRVRGQRLYLIPEGMPDLGNLRVTHPGVWLGSFKKDRFEPAHPLALFLLPGQARKVLDLGSSGRATSGATSRSPLQAYLAGESIPSDGPAGWTLVTVDGWPLGWGKRVQGVVKNHYPRGWQIYS